MRRRQFTGFDRLVASTLCLALAGTELARAAGTESPPAAPLAVPLPGHRLPALERAIRTAVGSEAARRDEPILLTVVLRRSDPERFAALLEDLYDPSSPRYRQWLTPAEIAERFGPSEGDYAAVRSYFERSGLQVTEGSASRTTITLRGRRGQAESALSVRIGDYSLAGRRFYANDSAPSLPPDLAAKVEAIAGLSDLGQPQRYALARNLGATWCEVLLTVYGPALLTTGLLGWIAVALCFIVVAVNWYDTINNYTNSTWNELEQASGGGRGSVTQRLTGAGQTIGILSFDTFLPSDIANFLALFGRPAERIDNLSQVPVNGGVAVPGANEDEVLLDINATMTLAPGAQIVVYSAPPATSWQTMFNAMIDGGVTIISNSWTSCEDQVSLAEVQSIDSVLQTAAAAGISVFNASGDTKSTCLDGSPDTIGVPSGSPSATAVGGTSVTPGRGFVYGSESWWDDGALGGGFGVSRFFTRPSYQDGFTGSAMRSVPDVALLADPRVGFPICQASGGGCPSGLLYGGTSLSAPLWAAYAATINESQGQRLGAFNPAIYPLASSGGFHDAASMGSDFAHVGLGSPNLDVLDRHLSGDVLGPPDPGLSRCFKSSVIYKGTEIPPYMLVPADGETVATVTAVLRDANLHSIAGQTVALTAEPSDGIVITPSSGVTSESNGAVVYTVTSTNPGMVVFTCTNETENMVITENAMVEMVVPFAAGGGIEAFPLTLPANGNDVTTITVTLRDRLGRPTPGKRIALSQGGGHSVVSGPSPPVTGENGQISFTAANSRNEVVTYTAFDETDQLEIPGSQTVTFDGGSTSCVTDPPTASPGFSLTTFATGFVARNFSYSNVNWGGCPGASNPAFASDASSLVAEFSTGKLFRLGPSGGTAASSDALSELGLTIGWPTFAPDGRLYASHGATGSGFTSGDIVEIDPATGDVLRIVAPNLACPTFAIDPLSGDIFVSNTCFGGPQSPDITRIQDPASAEPQVSVYAQLPEPVGGVLSFAPDGTLYVAYAYTGTAAVARIDGTDQPGPPQVTIVPAVRAVFWLRVGETLPDGSAKSLIVHDGTGLRLADITTDPPLLTPLANGAIGSGVIGPDGCLYAGASDTLYKLGPSDGSCGFHPSTAVPALSLSPSTVSPRPRIGSTVTFTATFQNIAVPEGTIISFRILGSNIQPKLARTNASGSATISYRGFLPGTDTVTASATIDGPRGTSTIELTSNSVKVDWSGIPVPALGLLAALALALLLIRKRAA